MCYGKNSKMGMVNRDDYRFLKIADALVAVNQKVNLIGVILEYSIPKRSKGTDWFCSLRIVDGSHDSRGLLVNMFAETKEKLPKVDVLGDIIELSQVQMKTHNAEIYALFNKKFSAFALYEGKYGQSCNPYQTSSRFRHRDQDMTFVTGLRKWVEGFQLDTAFKESLLLQQLKEGEHFNLVCKILHLLEVTEDESILFVWDGSDAPQRQIHSKLENEEAYPLRLQLEPQTLPRDILCTFPTVGTVLRVFVNQRNVQLNLSSLTMGRWVKLINLKFEVREGMWCGVLMSSSKARFLPNEDHLVLERQREFEKRLSSKWDRMPFTSFPWPSRITEIDSEHEEVPLVTLVDIRTYPQVTAKFKCIARVVAAVPWKVEDFRSLSGTYRVKLTLEDPTARVHAYVYDDDGEVFFDGYPPLKELTRKWNMLLGLAFVESGGEIVDASRNPPWVLLCVKSYYVSKSDVWGSRKFRIFGTKLLVGGCPTGSAVHPT